MSNLISLNYELFVETAVWLLSILYLYIPVFNLLFLQFIEQNTGAHNNNNAVFGSRPTIIQASEVFVLTLPLNAMTSSPTTSHNTRPYLADYCYEARVTP